MVLESISFALLAVSFIGVMISVPFFLGNVETLFGFNGVTKEADATVIGFVTRGLGSVDSPSSDNPVIEYYNEFLGQTSR